MDTIVPGAEFLRGEGRDCEVCWCRMKDEVAGIWSREKMGNSRYVYAVSRVLGEDAPNAIWSGTTMLKSPTYGVRELTATKSESEP